MTKEEVLAKVQEIAAEQLDVDKEEIVLTANIKDDLDAEIGRASCRERV